MTLDPIRFDSLPVSRWHNGAGRKADIAAGPDWQVGFAWLDADAPFSDFTGQDRTITLVAGHGFTLEFANRPALRVAEPFQPAAFDGGWPTQCRLLDGPCIVMNAMTARPRYRHTVAIVSAQTVTEIAPDHAEAFFLVLLTGIATLPDGATLGPKDSIHVTDPVRLRSTPGSYLGTIAIRHSPDGMATEA